MMCLGLESGEAVWKAQTNPLSYGGTQQYFLILFFCYFRLFYFRQVPKSTKFIKRPTAMRGPFCNLMIKNKHF